jgi:hypothetical protein
MPYNKDMVLWDLVQRKKTDNEIIEEISKQRKEYNEYVGMHKAGPMASIGP